MVFDIGLLGALAIVDYFFTLNAFGINVLHWLSCDQFFQPRLAEIDQIIVLAGEGADEHPLPLLHHSRYTGN